jgi:transcriptional regulator of aromatic amino acid metabolism
MIGQSVPMRRIMEVIERVAPARVSVFITGETGTGKEEAAKPSTSDPVERVLSCRSIAPPSSRP